MISLSSLTFFLKVMTREAHEQCTNHHEAVGASSSSRAPSAHPKQLTKRQRPSTLREESSPEDSLPRGAAPTPNEYECLKIRPLVAHTNREVVNYNKLVPRNIVTLHEQACYNSSKERSTDERFGTFLQHDWYHS
jgi:hypothetical protein